MSFPEAIRFDLSFGNQCSSGGFGELFLFGASRRVFQKLTRTFQSMASCQLVAEACL
jgi:hypothetical protein